jgi:hypothetical protein
MGLRHREIKSGAPQRRPSFAEKKALVHGLVLQDLFARKTLNLMRKHEPLVR